LMKDVFQSLRIYDFFQYTIIKDWIKESNNINK